MKVSESAIAHYAIEVPEAILDDLNRRLANTRLPQSSDLGWDGGMDANYLRELCGYWREEYNWRRAEQKLNQLANSTNSRTTERRSTISAYTSYTSGAKDLRHSRLFLLTDIPIRFTDS
jgi:hypothetical protein